MGERKSINYSQLNLKKFFLPTALVDMYMLELIYPKFLDIVVSFMKCMIWLEFIQPNKILKEPSYYT